jgi:hypothetical protein
MQVHRPHRIEHELDAREVGTMNLNVDDDAAISNPNPINQEVLTQSGWDVNKQLELSHRTPKSHSASKQRTRHCPTYYILSRGITEE